MFRSLSVLLLFFVFLPAAEAQRAPKQPKGIYGVKKNALGSSKIYSDDGMKKRSFGSKSTAGAEPKSNKKKGKSGKGEDGQKLDSWDEVPPEMFGGQGSGQAPQEGFEAF